MFRRSILAALATAAITAAVTAAAVITAKVLNENEEKKDETDDEGVHFIDLEEDDEKETAPEIAAIKDLYPYLDTEFIETQFDRNAEFNRQYPEHTMITISHKAKFADRETTEKYLKIAEENGFETEAIGAFENVITRKFFTTEGAILSDIYNVANQVNALNGIYEGYRIEE